MKSTLLFIIQVIIVLFFTGIAIARDNLNWTMHEKHFTSLKKKAKYRPLESALQSYLKQNPRTSKRDYICFELAQLYFDHLNQIERGYYYLDIVANSKNEKYLDKVKLYKKKFAVPVTKKRITRLHFYLQNYFIQFLKFPEKLYDLRKPFKSIRKTDFIDGYGQPFYYALEPLEWIPKSPPQMFKVISFGPDKLKGNQDDIELEKGELIRDNQKLPFNVIKCFQDKETWFAELTPNIIKSSKRSMQKESTKSRDKIIKVKINDEIDNYYVFAISPGGVILLKEGKILLIPS